MRQHHLPSKEEMGLLFSTDREHGAPGSGSRPPAKKSPEKKIMLHSDQHSGSLWVPTFRFAPRAASKQRTIACVLWVVHDTFLIIDGRGTCGIYESCVGIWICTYVSW